MTDALWFLLVGGLLLARGLTTSLLQRLPVTPAIVYLAVGVLVGPTVLDLFHFNPLKQSALLEVLTELVVLISLYSAGVKMPAPIRFARWRAPILLASVSMVASVGLVAAFAYYLLDLPLGAAVLLGAILAPTDPVLATDVQTRHMGDRDQLRFTLTCEAGMNDGSTFPFVMLGLGLLGLHELGDLGLRWILVDALWATGAGIAIGLLTGTALAHVSQKLRANSPRHELLDNFLSLGLIGVAYGLSLLLEAWGFLAVFFAAVSLRQAELKLAGADLGRPHDLSAQRIESEAENVLPECDPSPTVSGGSLIFKQHLERLAEMMLVLLIGGTLFLDSWSWRAVGLAAFLFVVARPVSSFIGLVGTSASRQTRRMVGWFGVRGIGSLYYLMYAIQQGLPEDLALDIVGLTLIAVTLSIIVHGITVKPMMSRFLRHRLQLPGSY